MEPTLTVGCVPVGVIILFVPDNWSVCAGIQLELAGEKFRGKWMAAIYAGTNGFVLICI